jgi:long-chain acyl-CoA synthetase
MLRASARRWPDNLAMIWHGKEDVERLNYTELLEKVRAYVGAVSTLGLQRGDRVCIQGENCVEWAWTDWACQCLGIVVVPIYPTLPSDQSQYIVRNCGARVVFVGGEDQAAKSEGLPDVRVVQLKDGEGSMAELADARESIPSEAEFHRQIDIAEPSDIASCIYTSGTTGDPKGAMLAHSCYTQLCESILTWIDINERDLFLSWLPMSHVYERVAGQVLPLSCGGGIAYVHSLRTIQPDMVLFKPTIMLCVPRMLEAMRDRTLDGVAKLSVPKKALFNWAYDQGRRKLAGRTGPLHFLADRLVCAQLREKMGGRMRFFVSGGSALAPAVSEFYLSMGMVVLQGYGLTETTAVASVNHPDRNRPHTVGEPIPCVETKIAADGEILFRGPSRMVGYYNMPEATEKAIDADGWFHSGDVGAWDGHSLTITDRKKDIIVLGNGKNVAPQPIENKLRESPYIADVVLLGDGKDHVSGIVVPDFEAIRRKMEEQGVEAPSDADMVALEPVRMLIKGEISKVNQTLADFERVKKHAVLDHAFSVENGELTPTLKVKRKVIREKYKQLIEWLER